MSKIPGDFVPLDVRYRRDRAIRSAGVAAELLYIRSLAHAKGNDTGGVIEDYDLPDLTAGMADGDAATAALVKVGLWVELSPTSWLIRSWEKWNPAGSRSTDGHLGNHNRWHRDRGIVAPDCEFCSPRPSPPNRPDIAPDHRPRIGSESQSRVEESREEKNVSASDDAGAEDAATTNADVLPFGPTATLEADFQKFWDAYPRHKDRTPAFKKYKAARRKAPAARILAGAIAYAEECEATNTPVDKIKYGATWLNGECWNNEPETPGDAPAASIGYQVVGAPPDDLLRQHGLLP